MAGKSCSRPKWASLFFPSKRSIFRNSYEVGPNTPQSLANVDKCGRTAVNWPHPAWTVTVLTTGDRPPLRSPMPLWKSVGPMWKQPSGCRTAVGHRQWRGPPDAFQNPVGHGWRTSSHGPVRMDFFLRPTEDLAEPLAWDRKWTWGVRAWAGLQSMPLGMVPSLTGEEGVPLDAPFQIQQNHLCPRPFAPFRRLVAFSLPSEGGSGEAKHPLPLWPELSRLGESC